MSDLAANPSNSHDHEPLITIAMPIYNAGRYLRPAVVSILQQTLADWELIIIDDGSSDGATETIRDIRDSRIRILRDGSNRGLAARLNEAIDLARGRYFARMDQDDISYPERLAHQLTMLEQHPEVDLVAVRCVAIDADDELVKALPYALAHEDLCAMPWRGFHLPHPTWMGRIGWFRRYRYASPGPYFCEDQELLLRSYLGSRFATLPEILFAYRVRSTINWKKSFKTRKTLFGIQFRHFFAMRQFHYGLLSAMAFVARTAMDVLNAFGQRLGGLGIHRHQAVALATNEQSRWLHVLATLNSTGT